MRVTRFGQSAIHIETPEVTLLVDPGSFAEDEVFSFPHLDAILVTHEHADHLDMERFGTLLSANPDVPVFAPQAVVDLLGPAITGHGRAISNGDQFHFGSVTVEVVGKQHQLILPSIPRCPNVGFVVSTPETGRLFIPGDSYETVPDNITTLALPLFGPWSSLRETIEFLEAVAPKHVFPNHDALLSASGRALYRRFITQSVGDQIRYRDLEPGASFTLTK